MTNIMFSVFFFTLTAIISAPHVSKSDALWIGGISLAAGFIALYQGIKK